MKSFTMLYLCAYITSAQYAFDYNNIANILPDMDSIQNNFNNITNGNFRFFEKSDCLNILFEDSPFDTYDGCYLQNPDAPYG